MSNKSDSQRKPNGNSYLVTADNLSCSEDDIGIYSSIPTSSLELCAKQSKISSLHQMNGMISVIIIYVLMMFGLIDLVQYDDSFVFM